MMQVIHSLFSETNVAMFWASYEENWANATAIGRIYTNDNEVQTEELTLLDIRQWGITRVSFCQSVFFGQ